MRPPSAATLGTGTASGSGGTSGYVSSISGSSGSKRDTSSAHYSPIQSFPPTYQQQVAVPATHSNQPVSAPGSGSGSGPGSVSTPSTGGYPPSSFGNGNLIPSSFSHRKQPTSSNPVPSAYSSPLPPPPPAQGLPVPCHVSSTELSSNRPLFSSTQGSGNPGSAPRQDEWARLPPVVRTYGKTNLNSTPTPAYRPANREIAEQILLSSSPISEPAVVSPGKRKSASPTKKRSQIVISDDDETEEEEYVEMRTPAAVAITSQQGPPRSRVEVIVPKSRPPPATKSDRNAPKTPKTNTRAKRHSASPDPLDLLASSSRTPARVDAATGHGLPSSSAISGSSRGGSVAPSLAGADGSSRRASSRVADNMAKAEKEKEERRRKRREEKERKKLEEEGGIAKGSEQENEKAKAKARPKSPVKTIPAKRREPSPPAAISEMAEIEESVIEIPPPPQYAATTERSSRKRKSDAAELNDVGDGGDEEFNSAEQEGKSKAKPKAAKKGKKPTPKKGKGKKVEPKAVEPELEEVVVEPEPDIEVPSKPVDEDLPVEEEVEDEQTKEPPKEPTVPPAPKSVSPARPPLRATSSNISTPSASSAVHRPSPGPTKPDGSSLAPGGIKWKAPRADLSSVLAKFGGAKRSGMSKRLKIAPLHQKIGPGVKALPPPPKKPEKKKAVDDDDGDDEDNEDNWEEDEDGNRVKKVKDGKKGMEWFMVED
ncbi:hypothetical protein IAU59_002654 [Kwoniella sp. CBS 9459]